MDSSFYWLRLVEVSFHYWKKSKNLPYFPLRLWVELTSICNYRCIMCPNRELEKKDRGFMEFELLKKIIDEAREFAFEVNLAHRGESLLYSRLIEAICYAKKRGMFTRLHTNGSLLNAELSNEMIRSGLDRLSFSFDGYEKETYERIRQGGDFEKTVSNIIRFLELKKEKKSKKPVTAIEVISFGPTKKKDLDEKKKKFLNNFKGLPLNEFVTKEMHNWAGHLGERQKGKKYTLCPFPWNALVVFWDGSVLACTQDFFGAYILGNVKHESLKKIWNGERMIELRMRLAEGQIELLKACSKCDRVWRRSFLGVPREYLWKFITKRMP